MSRAGAPRHEPGLQQKCRVVINGRLTKQVRLRDRDPGVSCRNRSIPNI
jgi:hypothetical protein